MPFLAGVRLWVSLLMSAAMMVSVGAHAQNIDEMRTLGLANGRLWKVMAAGEGHVAAMYAAGVIDASHIDNSLVADRYVKCNCGYGEIVAGVSKIYENNPAYLRIPVPYVIGYYLGLATGVLTQAEMQEQAADILRRLP